MKDRLPWTDISLSCFVCCIRLRGCARHLLFRETPSLDKREFLKIKEKTGKLNIKTLMEGIVGVEIYK